MLRLGLANTGEIVNVRRLELEVGDVGSRYDLVLLVAEEDPRRVVDDELLGLLIDLFSFFLIGHRNPLGKQLVDIRVLIESGVPSALARTSQQGVEEVVRVAVVALPAALLALELTFTGVEPVLGPLLGLDFGVHADLL